MFDDRDIIYGEGYDIIYGRMINKTSCNVHMDNMLYPSIRCVFCNRLKLYCPALYKLGCEKEHGMCKCKNCIQDKLDKEGIPLPVDTLKSVHFINSANGKDFFADVCFSCLPGDIVYKYIKKDGYACFTFDFKENNFTISDLNI